MINELALIYFAPPIYPDYGDYCYRCWYNDLNGHCLHVAKAFRVKKGRKECKYKKPLGAYTPYWNRAEKFEW